MAATTEMKLYDFQKKALMNIYKKYGPVKNENFPIHMLKDFFYNYQDSFFFLVSDEQKDYTIFNFSKEKTEDSIAEMVNELKECIYNRGELLDIDKTDPDAEDFQIMIWIKPIDKDSPALYYLVPYDLGVVKI